MCDAAAGAVPRAADRRLLPVERRLRVLHPAHPWRGRAARPGQRGGAQDARVRLDRRRPGGALLLRGPQQGVAVHPLEWPEPGREGRSTAGPRMRRWVRTFVRSEDRSTLRRAGLRGLRAGLRAAPRANAVVLEEAGLDRAGRHPHARPAVRRADQHLRRRPARLPPRGVPLHGRASRPGRPPRSCSSRTGPVGEELGEEIRHLVDESPVPVTHVVMPRRTWASARPSTPACGPCDHEIVARMDADDVSRPDRFELQMPGHRGRARTSSARGCSSSATSPATSWVVVRRRLRPGRDPPRGPLPRPVQPPHGGLPAQRGARRRRLRRHAPDGGLPAVHPDGHRRGAAGQPSPSRWSTTASATAPTRAAAAGRCCAPSCALQRRFRELGLTTPAAVPAQRGRARGLPPGPGRCEKGRVPPLVGEQIGCAPPLDWRGPRRRPAARADSSHARRRERDVDR